MNEIGKRIKERREALNLSVEQLAFILGKNRSTIYRYENGDIENMPVDTLKPIAAALKTSPAYLLGWDQDEIDAASEMQEDAAASRALEEAELKDWKQEETTLSRDLLTKEEFLKNLDDVILTNEQWYILWRLIEEIRATNEKEGE